MILQAPDLVSREANNLQLRQLLDGRSRSRSDFCRRSWFRGKQGGWQTSAQAIDLVVHATLELSEVVDRFALIEKEDDQVKSRCIANL